MVDRVNFGHPFPVDRAVLANIALTAGGEMDFPPAPKIVVASPRPGVGPITLVSAMLAGVVCLSGSASASSTSSTQLSHPLTQFTTPTAVNGIQRRYELGAVEKLTELRLRLGLTWAQVASIFEVSRRSVHSWASGEKLNERHASKLNALHARAVASGDITAFKREILTVDIASADYEPPLKGALLASDEAGVSMPPNRPARRVSLSQLRRR